MHEDVLLHSVLPLDSFYEYWNEDSCIPPKYDKATYAENLKDYKIYHMSCCQLQLIDEVDTSLAPDALLDLVVLKLMYHPRFPSTFFNYIANTVQGAPTLQAEDVEAYLEGNYGEGLQQPDCEYLSSILTLWGANHLAFYPTNLKIALAWIEKKQHSLPTWPPKLITLPVGNKNEFVEARAVVETQPCGGSDPDPEPDPVEAKAVVETQRTIRRGEQGLLPAGLEILIEALGGTDLLDSATRKLAANATSGAVAGVINYLYKDGYILSSRNSTIRTLIKELDFDKKGKRTVQGNKRESDTTKKYFDKTLEYFEEKKGLH